MFYVAIGKRDKNSILDEPKISDKKVSFSDETKSGSIDDAQEPAQKSNLVKGKYMIYEEKTVWGVLLVLLVSQCNVIGRL